MPCLSTKFNSFKVNSVGTEEELSYLYDTIHIRNDSVGKTPFKSSKLTAEKNSQSKQPTDTARHVKLNLSPERVIKETN